MSTVDQAATISAQSAAGASRRGATWTRAVHARIAAALCSGVITSPFVEESRDLSRPERSMYAVR